MGENSVQAALVGWEDSTTLSHGKYRREFAITWVFLFHLGKLFPFVRLVLARTYSMGWEGALKIFWNPFFPHDLSRLKLSVCHKSGIALAIIVFFLLSIFLRFQKTFKIPSQAQPSYSKVHNIITIGPSIVPINTSTHMTS